MAEHVFSVQKVTSYKVEIPPSFKVEFKAMGAEKRLFFVQDTEKSLAGRGLIMQLYMFKSLIKLGKVESCSPEVPFSIRLEGLRV